MSYELVIISNCMDSWVDFWVGIQSAGDLVSQTSKVRILYSTEDKLSPFDSKSLPCVRPIKIEQQKFNWYYL